jgi:chemotaxis protein histidine kinase CheA
VHHFTKTRGQELGNFEEEEESSEVELEDSAREEVSIPDATDEFMAIFFDEAEEILENIQSLVERWQSAPQDMRLMRELQRELHTLKGGARMVGIESMANLSHSLESVLTRIVEGSLKSNPKLLEIVQNSVNELVAMLEAVHSNTPLETPYDLITQMNNMSIKPFARVSPRLQRIVRLMARESRKNVEFTINGEDIAIEPSVLNNIVFPLEQLLRGTVQYGIEDAETRQQVGKSPTAKITIDVTREDSKLVVRVSDDGKELDLPAIRRKAVVRGIIKPGVIVSDQELVQSIMKMY